VHDWQKISFPVLDAEVYENVSSAIERALKDPLFELSARCRIAVYYIFMAGG